MKLSPLRHVMEVVGVTAFVLVLIFINNDPTSAQTAACPAGTQPATAADLTAMKDGGIPNPQVGECWASNSAVVGQTPDTAKQDLMKFAQPGVNIVMMNATFAQNLDTLLNAANQTPVCKGIMINSGYRTAAQQLAIMEAHPGQYKQPLNPNASFHVQGLAADLQYPDTSGGQSSPTGSAHTCNYGQSGSACYKWIVSYTSSGSAGLQTYGQAYPGTALTGECNHVQATTGGGPASAGPGSLTAAAPAKPGAALAQDLDGALDLGTDSGAGAGAGTSPAVDNAGAATSCQSGSAAYNGTCYPAQNAGQNCTAGTISLGGACVPMSMMQSLLSPQQSTIPPLPPPPASTPATTQTNAQAQASPNVLQTTPGQSTVNNANINSNVNAASTSATALLEALENPQSNTQTSTQGSATSVPPVVLNPNTQAVQQLAPATLPSTPAPAQTNSASLGPATPERSGAAPSTQTAPGNTFTSGNLTATQNGYAPQPSTFSSALSVLQNLQGELINALQYLKPFGGTVPGGGE